ncbi:MAG: hypothetical protein RL472_832 [Pseudomonadota bacterium]
MTRTWYSLPEQDVFGVAGLWRSTPEWGDVYTMVMVDGHPQMAEGRAEDALALCQTWDRALQVERTDQRWAG